MPPSPLNYALQLTSYVVCGHPQTSQHQAHYKRGGEEMRTKVNFTAKDAMVLSDCREQFPTLNYHSSFLKKQPSILTGCGALSSEMLVLAKRKGNVSN